MYATVARSVQHSGDMVTARDSEIDKVVGLELSAGELRDQAYSARELIARIRAVLRRGSDDDSEMSDGVLQVRPVRMDVGAMPSR